LIFLWVFFWVFFWFFFGFFFFGFFFWFFFLVFFVGFFCCFFFCFFFFFWFFFIYWIPEFNFTMNKLEPTLENVATQVIKTTTTSVPSTAVPTTAAPTAAPTTYYPPSNSLTVIGTWVDVWRRVVEILEIVGRRGCTVDHERRQVDRNLDCLSGGGLCSCGVVMCRCSYFYLSFFFFFFYSTYLLGHVWEFQIKGAWHAPDGYCEFELRGYHHGDKLVCVFRPRGKSDAVVLNRCFADLSRGLTPRGPELVPTCGNARPLSWGGTDPGAPDEVDQSTLDHLVDLAVTSQPQDWLQLRDLARVLARLARLKTVRSGLETHPQFEPLLQTLLESPDPNTLHSGCVLAHCLATSANSEFRQRLLGLIAGKRPQNSADRSRPSSWHLQRACELLCLAEVKARQTRIQAEIASLYSTHGCGNYQQLQQLPKYQLLVDELAQCQLDTWKCLGSSGLESTLIGMDPDRS
jgi:hypothetical protein